MSDMYFTTLVLSETVGLTENYIIAFIYSEYKKDLDSGLRPKNIPYIIWRHVDAHTSGWSETNSEGVQIKYCK